MYIIDIFKAHWCVFSKELVLSFELNGALHSLIVSNEERKEKPCVVQIRLLECATEQASEETKIRLVDEEIPGFPTVVLSKRSESGSTVNHYGKAISDSTPKGFLRFDYSNWSKWQEILVLVSKLNGNQPESSQPVKVVLLRA